MISEWEHNETKQKVFLEGYRVWFKPNFCWKIESIAGKKPRPIRDKCELKETMNRLNYTFIRSVDENPYKQQAGV